MSTIDRQNAEHNAEAGGWRRALGLGRSTARCVTANTTQLMIGFTNTRTLEREHELRPVGARLRRLPMDWTVRKRWAHLPRRAQPADRLYATVTNWRAQPPSAVRATTSQGGAFQKTKSVNAARADPKSAADMALRLAFRPEGAQS